MCYIVGRAIAEAVSRWLPNAAVWVRTPVWQVGFVVDNLVSEQVFSQYGFPCQNRSFHQLLHTHNHPVRHTEVLRRADHRPRSPADCPRSSNRNETESLTEAAKAQNWAVELKEKKICVTL
jgi:hypothetical protein